MNKDPKTLEYATLATSENNALRWRRASAICAILSLPVAVLSVVAMGVCGDACPQWILLPAFGVIFLATVGSLIAVSSIVWIGAIRKRGGRLTGLEKIGVAIGLITIAAVLAVSYVLLNAYLSFGLVPDQQ